MRRQFVLLRVWVTVLLAFTISSSRAAPTPAEIPLPPPAAPVTAKLTAEQITAYRNYLDKSRRQAGVPGLALVIIQPAQTLLLEVMGKKSAAADGPVATYTHFALGPASGAVNSLLLARLDGQKLLDLDAPARRCWDEFKLDDAAALKIVTLRQLLAMTAGLPGRVDHFTAPASATPADLFTIVGQIPLTAQPGKIFEYCDASPAVAGYLAVYALNHRRAPEAGLPAGYAEIAKTQLFDPLGMKHATYDSAKSADDDQTTGHVRDGKGPWQPVTTPAKASVALLPACGLYVTANDVAAWLQCELTGGLGPDGKRLIEESAVQQRWRPESSLENRDFGLGWASQHYRGMEIIARIGEQDNQASLIAIIPQFRTAFAVLTNAGGHDAALFLQDALLNMADLLRESVSVK